MEHDVRAKCVHPHYLSPTAVTPHSVIDPKKVHTAAIGAVVILLAAFAVYGRYEAISMEAATVAITNKLPPAAAASPAPVQSAAVIETSPGAGWRLPGGGTAISRNGQYCLNAIRVAIPDGFNHVRYLAGTDPEAIRYLAQTRAEQQSTSFQSAPDDTDTGSMPSQNAFSNASRRVVVKLGSH